MEGSKQSNDVETKNKLSVPYMIEIMNAKKVSASRRALLFNLMEHTVDYRTLLKMKNHIFDRFLPDHEITEAEWKKESARFMHIHPEVVEKELLAEICVDGKISR